MSRQPARPGRDRHTSILLSVMTHYLRAGRFSAFRYGAVTISHATLSYSYDKESRAAHAARADYARRRASVRSAIASAAMMKRCSLGQNGQATITADAISAAMTLATPRRHMIFGDRQLAERLAERV